MVRGGGRQRHYQRDLTLHSAAPRSNGAAIASILKRNHGGVAMNRAKSSGLWSDFYPQVRRYGRKCLQCVELDILALIVIANTYRDAGNSEACGRG
jgi:hypothetical protein